jgi:hypothetical protein
MGIASSLAKPQCGQVMIDFVSIAISPQLRVSLVVKQPAEKFES